MITHPNINSISLIASRIGWIGFATLYAALVVWVFRSGQDWIDVPIAIPAMLGTALSILLGFRTASAYNRWWEARTLWGAIVNDSRTFTREVLTLLIEEDGERPKALQKKLIYRQIAWCYALRCSLRAEAPLTDVGPFLESEEIEALRNEQHVPNALLQTQADLLNKAYREGLLTQFFFTTLDATLKRLTDHMGGCERIKKTVFPGHYSFFISRTLLVFYILLPAGLCEHLGWFTIPIALVIELLFGVIETAGRQLQDPFENRINDTPMSAISRTIEINLRQQLGETDLPAKLEPVRGVLM